MGVVYRLAIIFGMILFCISLFKIDILVTLFKSTFVGFLTKLGKVSERGNSKYERKVHYGKKRLKRRNAKYSEYITILFNNVEGVTVYGFRMFLNICAVVIVLALTLIIRLKGILNLILIYVVIRFMLQTLVKLLVANKRERKEISVLNAVDIIISGIDSGTTRSIGLYIDTFDDTIKGAFVKFLNNIKNTVPFNKAMLELADDLGPDFEDFAQKAILHKTAGSDGLLDLFDIIIVINQRKRMARADINEVYSELKIVYTVVTLMLCVVLIALIGLNEGLRLFMLTTALGQFLIIEFTFIIAVLFGFLAIIRSKPIKE